MSYYFFDVVNTTVTSTGDLLVDPLVKLLSRLDPWWNWMAEITFGAIILRILIAILFGGILGIERASKKHAAGFRTYILCCVGACVAGLLNQFNIQFFGSGDGSRLGAGVIGGIGFLCAGSILTTSRNQIKGLTTAASLWASGCVGIAIGHGFYTLSIVTAVVIFVVLRFLPAFENYFTTKARNFTVHCELTTRTNLKQLITYLREQNLQVRNVEHNVAYTQSGLSVYTIEINIDKGIKLNQNDVIKMIESQEYCSHAEVLH